MSRPSGAGAGAPPTAAAAEEAEGRAQAYGLLADLVARGPAPATLEAARWSPLLAAALPGGPGPALDDAAADHERVLGREVPPFEGLFLDPEGTAGGEAAAALGDLLRRAGTPPDPRGEGEEHLSTLLRTLGLLSGAEADAVADGLPTVADRVRALAREVLDDHLLRWLPPFAAAVRRAGAPFPAALAAQVEGLVLLHREGLGPLPAAAPPLPDPALDLDDPETTLDGIAGTLARPARSGLLLTRSALARAGRAAGVPRGFGDRATEIANLLRAAGHLDRLGEALAALDGEVEAFAGDLRARAGAEPALAPWTAPWVERCGTTRRLLADLRARAAGGE